MTKNIFYLYLQLLIQMLIRLEVNLDKPFVIHFALKSKFGRSFWHGRIGFRYELSIGTGLE